MNTAYVYKWTHIPSYKWYIGSRTAKNAHPNDGYICSSRIVKPLILANPNEWKREIVAVGEAQAMYDLESEILDLFDAKHDPRSYNQHNNDAKTNMLGKKHSDITRKKISQSHVGKIGKEPWNKGKPFSDESRKKMSDAKKGKEPWNKGKTNIYSNETKEKIRQANLGKKQSEETRQKYKTRIPWNKGLKLK
jgi:hypothetical protein